MKRAILLQIDNITKIKERTLNDAIAKAISKANWMLSEVPKFRKFMDFHKNVYLVSKKDTSFKAQTIEDIERMVWRHKGKTLHALALKFTVGRSSKSFCNKYADFVELRIYPDSPIAIPITKNRNFQRYSDLLKSGWTCKTYGLTSDLQIVAYLSKEETELPRRKNIIGVDVNSKCFAVSVLSPDFKVLKQTYFGTDIWIKRKKIMRRRSLMQSSNNLSALRRLKNKEFNFVETNIGQMVKEITDLALRYDADIAIENLKRFSKKGKRFNREVMRIPFFKFREILASRCFDKGITLNIVDSWHTSKYCSHCGAVARNGHDSGNYALFICKECGVIVNSDRNASKNIAIKSLLERGGSLNQKLLRFSSRRVPVNGLLRPDAVVEPIVAVRHISSTHGKPSNLLEG